MSDVGKGFKIESYTIKDDPNALKKVSKNFLKTVLLIYKYKQIILALERE